MAKKVVRVFLDSNVILSGLISDRGAPRIILDLLTLKLPFLVGITGRFNLSEIERTLKKKLPHALSVYQHYFPLVDLTVIPVPTAHEVGELSGKIVDKDAPVLASAIRGKADFLVTGDKRHFQKLKARGDYAMRIVTPAEFIDHILPEVLKELEGIE